MTTRRYEVLLLARFNNGREVAETCMRCLPDTLMEVDDPDTVKSVMRAGSARRPAALRLIHALRSGATRNGRRTDRVRTATTAEEPPS